MTKILKRPLSIILAVLMVMSVFIAVPTVANAASPTSGDPGIGIGDIGNIVIGNDPTPKTVDLSTLNTDYEAQDGDILTGTLAGNYKITVAAGATITLKDADITCLSTSTTYAGITPLGDLTIILEGENMVKGGNRRMPGICVPENTTLTIEGTGSLEASSGGNFTGSTDPAAGCGIGAAREISSGTGLPSGNIVINGGTITANGGNGGTGIGGAANSTFGDITINGGTVTASGRDGAAGIGGGNSGGSCGNITINGGTVTATGSGGGAGIGCGRSSACGNITIADTVTKVTAVKGDSSPNSIGQGSGLKDCGTITIGGEVTGNITQSTYVYPTYTVTWKNGETTLETDTGVESGATPSFDGATPTKASDSDKHYTFSGWSDGTNTYAANALPEVSGDVTYTAQFTGANHTWDTATAVWDAEPVEDFDDTTWEECYTADVTVSCANCDATHTFTAKTKNWMADVVDYSASCDTDGYTSVKVYATVDDTEISKEYHLNVIPASHDVSAQAAKAATCTEAGYKAYWKCGICDKYFSDAAATTEIADIDAWKAVGGDGYIAPLGHNKTHYAAQAATFDAEGNTEYWYCDRCEKYFSDENCENEITQAQTIIPQKVAVAQIGSTKYESLSEAITAAEDGDTITVIANTTVPCYTTQITGKAITIDATGYTVTGTGYTTFPMFNVKATGGLTLTGGTFSNPGGIISNGGTAVVDGATLTADGFAIQNKGNLTISSGTITATEAAVTNGATTAVTTITGGTFTGKIKMSNDGDGTFAVSGGTFDRAVPEEFCADGYIPTDDGNGNYGVKVGSYVAQIGSDKYESITDAITAAEDGDTITVLANTTVPCYTTQITGKDITIDATGYTVTGTGYTTFPMFNVKSDGGLTLTGGTFTNPGGIISNSGTAVVDGATLTAGGFAIQNKGDLTISSGTITATEAAVTNGATTAVTTITGGTFTGKIKMSNDGDGSIAISGGTFDRDVDIYAAPGYVGTQLSATTFGVKVDTNPLGLAPIIGFQKKAADDKYAQGVRIVTKVGDCDLNQFEEYGYVVVKVTGKEQATANFNNMKAYGGNGEKTIKCNGTINTIDGLGEPYVTLAVNGMTDGQQVAARFYAIKNGVTYYSNYVSTARYNGIIATY